MIPICISYATVSVSRYQNMLPITILFTGVQVCGSGAQFLKAYRHTWNIWASNAKQRHANTMPIYSNLVDTTRGGRPRPLLCPIHYHTVGWCLHAFVWHWRPKYSKFVCYLRNYLAKSSILCLLEVVSQNWFFRSGSTSEFRTHKCHKILWHVETTPMGPILGSASQISRKTKLNFQLEFELFGGIAPLNHTSGVSQTSPLCCHKTETQEQ